MDEKGILLCLHKSPTVITEKGRKNVHYKGKEHSESLTVVGCGNAIGNVVAPMVIFKGVRKNPDWANDLPPGSIIEMSPKGSMTSILFTKWLHHFAKFKPSGKYTILCFALLILYQTLFNFFDFQEIAF